MRPYQTYGYVRVGKKMAKRLYDKGEIIYLCNNRLRPGKEWSPEIAIARENRSDSGVQYFVTESQDFERLVEAFEYYNCLKTQYACYYVKKCCR